MGAFWHQLNKHDVEESAPGVPVFFQKMEKVLCIGKGSLYWKRFSVLEKVLCIRNKS
jgi:hypothetical protein